MRELVSYFDPEAIKDKWTEIVNGSKILTRQQVYGMGLDIERLMGGEDTTILTTPTHGQITLYEDVPPDTLYLVSNNGFVEDCFGIRCKQFAKGSPSYRVSWSPTHVVSSLAANRRMPTSGKLRRIFLSHEAMTDIGRNLWKAYLYTVELAKKA